MCLTSSGHPSARRTVAGPGTALRSHHHAVLHGDGTPAALRLSQNLVHSGGASPHAISIMSIDPSALHAPAHLEANVPRPDLQRRRTMLGSQCQQITLTRTFKRIYSQF